MAISRISIGLLATTAALYMAPVFAQTVTLKTPDGALSLTGKLLEFDGQSYRLETLVGTIDIDVASVICVGEDCPDLSELKAEFSIAASDAVGTTLVANIIEEYAFLNNLISEQTIASVSGGEVATMELLSESDDSVALITVEGSSSERVFEKLAAGQSAISVSARPVSAAEVRNFEAAGLSSPADPAQERVFALDALVPLVASQNKTRSISIDELARIAAGRIRNWSELGGDDIPIRMVLPANGTESFEVFNSLVMEPNRLRVSARIERAASDQDVSEEVTRDPTAIGIASVSAQRNAQIVPIRRICGPLAKPTDFSVKAEEYPLTRRLFMYTSGAPIAARTADLIDFATSDAARDAIQNAGFVDLAISASPIDDQGIRMTAAMTAAPNTASLTQLQDLAAELVTAERLSTAFRFTTGSSGLDTKALGDVSRMANYLSEENNAEREILVLGFTDAIGRADLNVLLGQQRAEQVRDSLLVASAGQISADRFTVRSYGPLAPVGCNETAEGRGINRRVEIWIRDRVTQ